VPRGQVNGTMVQDFSDILRFDFNYTVKMSAGEKIRNVEIARNNPQLLAITLNQRIIIIDTALDVK
jgi:hypothetical protein